MKATRTTPITTVLTWSERPDPLIGTADVADWPVGNLEKLLRLGVLANADPADSFACDACGFDHVEPVQWIDGPGDRRRPFIVCPSAGAVSLDGVALRRWVVRLPALAKCVAASIGATGGVSERVPDRVWKLGTLRAGGRTWIGFLAAGLTRPDVAALVAGAAELAAANALVFVPSAVPPAAVWRAGKPAAVLSLCDLLSLAEDGLAAAPGFLESALPAPARPVPKGPARAFPTPPGTAWEDVSLIVEDFRVVVRVGAVAQSFTFAVAGFENKRRKGTPDELWTLLNLLAQHRGELGTGDHLTTKSGRLKQKVSTLRDRLRALLAIDDDPFHPNRNGQPYRTRFTIRRAGPETFPTPAGAAWDDISVTEVADGVIEVSVVAAGRGVTYTRGDEPDDCGRWEGATEANERRYRYALGDLGLTGPDGQRTAAGEALLTVLRAGGRLTRPVNDTGLLTLSGTLTRFFQLDDPPFTFDRQKKQWVAQFEASAVAPPIGN